MRVKQSAHKREAARWRDAALDAAWVLRALADDALRPTEGGEPMSLEDALRWLADELESGRRTRLPVRYSCDCCGVVGVSLGVQPPPEARACVLRDLAGEGWRVEGEMVCPSCKGGE